MSLQIQPPKFLHVSTDVAEILKTNDVRMTGSACWSKAFGGDWISYGEVRGNLNQYDIIYINLSSNDHTTFLAQKVRAEIDKEKTTLVIGVDYSVALWKQHYNPAGLTMALRQADFVICQEPSAVGYLKTLLGQEVPVQLLSHPVDIDGILAEAMTPEVRTGGLCAFIHRYDNEWLTPSIVCTDIGYRTYAVAWPSDVRLTGFFDIVRKPMPYSEYLKFAAQQLVMVDSYHGIPAAGRIQMENAIFGVPTIGTKDIYMQELLWPSLTTDSFDIAQQRAALINLVGDEDIYNHVITNAFTAIKRYGLAESKERMLDMIRSTDNESQIPCDGAIPDASECQVEYQIVD